ncbi:hypothetical protein LCGC14_2319420, partial [marine sediment metagenome]
IIISDTQEVRLFWELIKKNLHSKMMSLDVTKDIHNILPQLFINEVDKILKGDSK